MITLRGVQWRQLCLRLLQDTLLSKLFQDLAVCLTDAGKIKVCFAVAVQQQKEYLFIEKFRFIVFPLSVFRTQCIRKLLPSSERPGFIQSVIHENISLRFIHLFLVAVMK